MRRDGEPGCLGALALLAGFWCCVLAAISLWSAVSDASGVEHGAAFVAGLVFGMVGVGLLLAGGIRGMLRDTDR